MAEGVSGIGAKGRSPYDVSGDPFLQSFPPDYNAGNLSDLLIGIHNQSTGQSVAPKAQFGGGGGEVAIPQPLMPSQQPPGMGQQLNVVSSASQPVLQPVANPEFGNIEIKENNGILVKAFNGLKGFVLSLLPKKAEQPVTPSIPELA